MCDCDDTTIQHYNTTIVVPGKRIAEEESDIASIRDIDKTAPGILTSDSDIITWYTWS